MKSTFWMNAQEAEDEIKKYELVRERLNLHPHTATCECGATMECDCKDGNHDTAVYRCFRCEVEFYGGDED